MNKTKYFVLELYDCYVPAILWRLKNNRVDKFIKSTKRWKKSTATEKSLYGDISTKQITQKHAQKLFPAAFRKSVKLNPRTKKFPKTAKFKKIKSAIVPCSCHPKSEAQKVAEFEGEFFGMAPKVTTKEEFFNAYNEPPPVNMMPESTFKSFWRRLKEFLLDNDSASSRLFPLIK